MSDSPKLAQHITALQALTQLRENPGWALICVKFQERMTQLENRRDDLNTSPTEAEALRQTRARVLDQFSPAKILSDLVAHHSGGIESAKRKLDQQTQLPT